jgi:hypothetical protein
MLDGGDNYGVSTIAEADAIVAYAEPQFGRFDGLNALDIAGA